MKLLTFRNVFALTLAVALPPLAMMASCSGNSSPDELTGGGGARQTGGTGGSAGGSKPDGSAAGSGGSGGGAAGSSGSGGAGTAGSGGSGGSDMVDAGIPTYDGPPANVDGGMLSCATPDALPIKFNPMYSGFDGKHTYQVPAFVVGATPSDITWGASDESMVSMQPYISGIMITTKKAGDVQIIAKKGTECGSALLHIEAYTEAEWDLGNARYNNGNQIDVTKLMMMIADAGYGGALDGSFDGNYDALPDVMITNPFEDPPAACTNCHGSATTSTGIFSAVSHTPEQTGGYSEDVLTNVFAHGIVPDGGYYDDALLPQQYWSQFHTWTDIDTPEKQKGMNAYLRSLTPQAQTGCREIFNLIPCGP